MLILIVVAVLALLLVWITNEDKPKAATKTAAESNENLSENFIPISKSTIAEMIIRKQQLEAAKSNGVSLTLEEKKELAMLELVMEDPKEGESPLFVVKELDIDQIPNVIAFGGYSFGRIRSILSNLGFAKEDVISFLDAVSSGKFPLNEALGFLADCEDWDKVKGNTQISREEFFADRLRRRTAAAKMDPSRN